MARKPIDVDQVYLTELINRLEKEKEYSTQSALFNDVVSEYHSARGVSFSPAFVYLKIKEWKIELKTQKGKKGGGVNVGEHERGKKLKSAKSVNSLQHLTVMLEKDAAGKRYLGLVTKIKKGSLKAAIKLKCLDCANFQTEEVKDCQCFDCPLHAIRPYQ